MVDGIDVEVGLVMTDTALLAGTNEAAELQGYGPIPAELARGLLRPSATGPVQGSAQGEPCPDGIRCTSARCTLVHGTPAARVTSAGPPALTTTTTPGVAKVARAWVRRLYVDPGTGVLRDRDPRRRLFTGGIRALVIARDRTCRSSWCDAPLRTVDHITRFSEGGLTTADNGRGLCERCNLARERPRALPPPPEHYRPPPPQLPAFATGDPPATRQR
ncbi:HNH endonuclease [Ornithinimicrobium sp. LYQ92]|uniref:HNH endonuclease n=1 Tax=Serinicoccus sp. LYQ92 TaxID=3378798 RepID=UPI00385349A3